MLYDLVKCPHRVTMDLFAHPDRRDEVSPFVQLLWERGAAHEKDVAATFDGRFLDLSRIDSGEKEGLTLAAMRRGENLIYGGRISADDLLGEPDLLERKGNGYVAGDIKSGAGEEGASEHDDGRPKLHYAVQLALYTDILERLDLCAGRSPFIWDIHHDIVPYDLMEPRGTRNPHSLWDDYITCLSQARGIVAGTNQTQPAYSTSVCNNCVWYTACIKDLEAANDLTLIPELGRTKRDSLIDKIRSISEMAVIRTQDFLEHGKSVFPGIGAQTLEKFHERAKLISAADGKPYLRGNLALPTAEKELFFDIEVDSTRDFCYLHGFVERLRGDNSSERFIYFFADELTAEAEKRAFADALDFMLRSQPCAIYYYSKYERTIYRKLRKKYPDVCTEDEIERLFDPSHSVDLYFDVVLKATEWPTRDYSIKTLAKYLGFTWRDTHPSGAASIEWFYRWIEQRNPQIRDRILVYNEDDCRATRVLVDGIKSLPAAPTEESWIGSSHFQTKLLRPRKSAEEYRIYRAGLEWNLIDPIVIESRDDIRSESLWRDRMTPYHHQVSNLVSFCRRLPVTLLADDVGLGKTISAGLVMSELISRSRLSKILVVCPKLLREQWQEELKEKFNIDSVIATGRELLDADPDKGAVITTYHTARLYLDSIPQDRFQMLVLDEAHKLRNLYGVDTPPQVAICFRRALEERRFRFVLMLTATPIHNRLWDLYSLVDLLTVARGHKNPFGSEGMFARKFIADSRDQARQLKEQSRDEFRSIVYGYMSRVRRDDARLYFPKRVVQMHQVNPTPGELDLIEAIRIPIQQMGTLLQISVLQALVSSPEALSAQLSNMARKGTAPLELATTVSRIVARIGMSAKLQGLGALVEKLRRENPERWRLVVFTTRLETQTTIQTFLESRGLKVGIINGSSGSRNKVTLSSFRKERPEIHVIVSTEAGSEGINLQVANVLVNYDLPWNPMTVEQRIGRIQRLASDHENVGIFNITLRGTFEEYIVGRLMEKLQMAAHAIGDIDALLDAAGVGGEDISFEEQIRQLVVAALAGKDVELATRQAEESIDRAKDELEREEANINAMLGSMHGHEYVGPRAPRLPETIRSMDPKSFVLEAFRMLGATVTQKGPESYLVEDNGGREFIRFESNVDGASTYFAPGTPPFSRLVDRVIATGIHEVDDLDNEARIESLEIAERWVRAFGGKPNRSQISKVNRCFVGRAVVRVRATVAHDSYERLVDLFCVRGQHITPESARKGLEPLPHTIQSPSVFGLDPEKLVDMAKRDNAISEFCRFYLERRAKEMGAAGGDERKKKKLEDEFTPRLEVSLVAVEGRTNRQIEVRQPYVVDGELNENVLLIEPLTDSILDPPEMAKCARSGNTVPINCLDYCQISRSLVQRHFLISSDLSGRRAQPEFTVVCSLSGKRLLQDEAEASAVTGNLVEKGLLRSSTLSGKRAEPDQFGKCEFTGAEVLKSELLVSEVSAKRYRVDEQRRSAISGAAGHNSEFLVCQETGQFLAPHEAEKCEITGNYVRRGTLQECAITRKRVLPSQLVTCAATGKHVLPSLLVTSSVSGSRILESVAVRSANGNYCAPLEAEVCVWTGERFHPNDLRTCELTGLLIHFRFIGDRDSRLQPLVALLDGVRRNADDSSVWETVALKTSEALGAKRCRVEASVLSPNGKHLAACVEVRTLLGFRVRQVGVLFELESNSILGRVVQGQRTKNKWHEED